MGIDLENDEVQQYIVEHYVTHGEFTARIMLEEHSEGVYSFEIEHEFNWEHPSEHEDVYESFSYFIGHMPGSAIEWGKYKSWEKVQVRFSPMAYKALYGGEIRCSWDDYEEDERDSEMDEDEERYLIFRSPQIDTVFGCGTKFKLPKNIDDLVPDEKLIEDVEYTITSNYLREVDHRSVYSYSSKEETELRELFDYSWHGWYVSVESDDDHKLKLLINVSEDKIQLREIYHSSERTCSEYTSADEIVQATKDLYRYSYRWTFHDYDEEDLRECLKDLLQKEDFFLKKVNYHFFNGVEDPVLPNSWTGLLIQQSSDDLRIRNPAHNSPFSIFIHLLNDQFHLWKFDGENKLMQCDVTSSIEETLQSASDHFRKSAKMKWSEEDKLCEELGLLIRYQTPRSKDGHT